MFTADQRRVIDSMTHCLRESDVARVTGVPLATIEEWMHCPPFVREVRRARRAASEHALRTMTNCVSVSVELLAMAIEQREFETAVFLLKELRTMIPQLRRAYRLVNFTREIEKAAYELADRRRGIVVSDA